MNIGVQYYRAPFPEMEYWKEDIKNVRNAGLNTLQLWVLWGWVESASGKFDFSDYDRLVELADKNGLQVVLSSIAEIQPMWIHREVPGSEMIDRFGKKVISTLRHECNFGLTPGGCTDNPGVQERMKLFLETLGKHYADCPNLHGWDLWNELRWNIQADELVCFCPHTLEEFRNFLKNKYGSLDGLNEAWKRRYIDWQDVMPGKAPDRPYSEMMAWQDFITHRANRHGAWRYEIMRGVDKVHTMTAHGAAPSIGYSGDQQTYPIDRGNDWELAKSLDGIGCSSFPAWGNIDDAEFGSRVEMVHAAADGKHIWLSELQGGRAGVGFDLSAEVTCEQQQRWLWNGIACGADTILFWCWRDEVFGREAGNFGLFGNDELSPARIAAMRESGDVLEKHRTLFDNYTPDEAQVAILFSPDNYYLAWAQDGSAKKMQKAIDGYARALVKHSIPSTFIESRNLADIDRFKLIIVPRVVSLTDEAEEQLVKFVRNGGTILVESECGAFNSDGFYRYPEKRFLNKLGIREAGRRPLLSPVEFTIDGRKISLECDQWLTPFADSENAPVEVYAKYKDLALGARYSCGKGNVIALGSYFGNSYLETENPDFEAMMDKFAAEAGVERVFEMLTDKFIYVKSGTSDGKQMLFCFFPDSESVCRIRLARPEFNGSFTDLLSGQKVAVVNGVAEFKSACRNLAVLVEDLPEKF